MTAVIVDAWRKGLRGFDAEKAYAACRQTAAGVGAQTNRPDNGFYLEHGFVPDKLSWTLDKAYYDWCVAQFAQALGKTDDARLFFSRGANYVKVYDPGVESMRARQADGGWLDWKGRTAPRGNNQLHFDIEGPGEIVATDNGDPTSFDPFQSHDRRAFNGLCLVIIRAKPGHPGKIKLTATSYGLETASTIVRTRSE